MQSAKGTALVRPIHGPDSRINAEQVVHAATGHAERARASHQLFWNCAPEGLFAIRAFDDGHFAFDDANPAYRRLAGPGDVEFAGRQPDDCLPADMAEALVARCRDCVATGVSIEYDETAGPPDRHRRWRTTLMPMKNPDTGRVSMLMGRLRDLGSDRDNPEADGHSRRLLERIVDASPDVIYVFDLESGRSAFLSSRVREALGHSREFLQSLDVSALLELIHPEDLPTVKQHMLRVRALGDGAVATVEYRCRTGDGVYRWFRSKETVFSRTKDGGVEKVVGILSDIDRLKKARIAFTDMNARLTAILASISDCYLTIDHECRLTNVNAAAARWLGKTRDDVVGKNYRDVFAGSAVQAAVREAGRERRAVHAELPSQLHPGRWIELHVYPSGDGVNIFFSDITKRKHAEESAARSQALLNASIDALSAHIVILDAAGTIVASNKAWRRFAAGQWRPGLAVGPGSNFVSLFERGSRSTDIPEIAAGVRSLLAGRRTTMRHIYHLGIGERGRWYQLIAARFMHEGKAFAVVATEDVTDVREAKRALGELSERMLTLQEDERQRIAAELHDSTAQHLAAIGLNAMSLRARSASDTDTQRLWEDVEVSLEEATRELRAFTYLLHPTRLESDGLNAALQRYIEGFAARTGLMVTLKLSADIDSLPISLRRSMLRIVQEALANVHRHASASRVSVKQKLLGNRLHLVISDDGSGIKGATAHDGTAGTPLGVGIPGMRERLRQFGGNLEIKTGSRGTTVHVSVPFGEGWRDSTFA